MTNHWNDLANSDCIFIIGSNAAANHPMSFKYVQEAMARGARLIVVDPRFTRTATHADIYAGIRSGTDVALIGGMIRYVLEDMQYHPDRYNLTYLREYTNAAYLISPDFRGPDELDGLFSGFDPVKRTYDRSTWQYQLQDDGIPRTDPTLQDPNCVFQILRRHFARYTVNTVVKITGVMRERFDAVCETFAATGAPGKAGTILYAMGATQHTNGTQVIRAYGILQLLLGNIGIAGGGINAMRGESNVQGSTDHGLLYHILPGYLKAPLAADFTLADYVQRTTPKTSDPRSANWWSNTPKYIVSLLKAWYGESATAQNDFGFGYLPRISAGANYSWMPLFHAMHDGLVRGLMCWGQNPAVSGPNLELERKALDRLEWLVAVDLWETETAAHWERPDVDPAEILTEVFLLPAAASFEKEGSISNSGRWAQWRWKGAEPPGEARDDLWIIVALMQRLQELYTVEGGPHAEAITDLTWDYGQRAEAAAGVLAAHIDPAVVAREISGRDLTTGKLLGGFAGLKEDGTTSSGCWIYCGSFTEDGNLMARRDNSDASGIGLYSNWAWSWPMNRRIIYNRASVDLDGQPWDAARPVIRWDGEKWVGDVPDGGFPPLAVDPEKGRLPFIMVAEGRARLFGAGLVDGPLPEHYEPWESPLPNVLTGTQNDPVIAIWDRELQQRGDPGRFPIVATTYRLSEHWQAGQMTRNLPWLVELFPQMFVEISEELAGEKGLQSGDDVIVETARGSITTKVVVTRRLEPFYFMGRRIHQIAMPWHWGYEGLSVGQSANILAPNVGDANTMIPEFKAFLCDVRRA
jgi:formate dehydrogenase-N alpha subunit